MKDENSTDWFKEVDIIIADSLKFKGKLNIGKDAYTSLLIKDNVGTIWNVAGTASAGAAAASSTAVASTFFAPSGILAAFGIGAAATPLGWVVAAAILSGGTCYGLTRYFKNAEKKLIRQIPEFISTPLDVLGLGLFDLMAPLALKVAKLDGDINEMELEHINRYFIQEWGYDQEFIDAGLAFTESRLSGFSIEELVQMLAEYQIKNKDCNFDAMSKEVISFLRDIIEVDDKVVEHEEKKLQEIQATFNQISQTWFSKVWDETSEEITSKLESLKGLFDKSDAEESKHADSLPDIVLLRLESATTFELQRLKDQLGVKHSASYEKVVNEYYSCAGNFVVNIVRNFGLAEQIKYADILIDVLEDMKPTGMAFKLHLDKLTSFFSKQNTIPGLVDQRPEEALIKELELFVLDTAQRQSNDKPIKRKKYSKTINATLELILIGQRQDAEKKLNS